MWRGGKHAARSAATTMAMALAAITALMAATLAPITALMAATRAAITAATPIGDPAGDIEENKRSAVIAATGPSGRITTIINTALNS